MENNKVSVKIYGHEYIIAGNKPRDHIIKVADRVDGKMHEIAKALPAGSTADLAVLSAVNIADDYYSNINEVLELKNQRNSLKRILSIMFNFGMKRKKDSFNIKKILKP